MSDVKNLALKYLKFRSYLLLKIWPDVMNFKGTVGKVNRMLIIVRGSLLIDGMM
jgi:hypothetical protein